MSENKSFTAALIQTCTSRDVERNLREIGAIIREAAGSGAHYIQTPEVTTVLETDSKRMPDVIKPERDNPALAHFAGLAKDLGIWLHIGSMAVTTDEPRYANRAFLFAPTGEIAARYDKIHMFDVEIGEGQSYRESKRYAPGKTAVLAALPWGKLGITICYDMRFPALYRELAQAGAEILAVPSSFTVPTGNAHWHTILRARAIENQCFVLAAAQAGDHECGRQTYGHSIAISPWGKVLAEADGDTPGFITADIDLAEVSKARGRIPSLSNDQPFDITQTELI